MSWPPQVSHRPLAKLDCESNTESKKTKFSESPAAGVALADLVDGAGYRASCLTLSQPNLFTRIGSIGDLVVKVPSERGRSDFDKYVRREIVDPQDIRHNEDLERLVNLTKAIERFPEFGVTRNSFGDECAHFLVVHRLQHASARFIALALPRWLLGWRTAPAIVQERIRGIRFFDMVEPMEGVLLSRYSHLRPQLKHLLAPLVNSDVKIHIDWNIENFIWHEAIRCRDG